MRSNYSDLSIASGKKQNFYKFLVMSKEDSRPKHGYAITK